MGDNFWESLRQGFTQLRAECAIDPRFNSAGRLTAIWCAQPVLNRWSLRSNGQDGNGVAKRFEWFAESAAAKLGFAGTGQDAAWYWLDQIKAEAPSSHVRTINSAGRNGDPDVLYSVEILDICGLSADYCRKCEANETRSKVTATTKGSATKHRFEEDADARPLGGNPFAEDHPAHLTFEEATWKAKKKIASFKLEFLRTVCRTPAEFLDALLTYRKRWFTEAAFEATLIVGNEETAEWYEYWINTCILWLLESTLNGLKTRDPKAGPLDTPFFSPEELQATENNLKVELMRMASHYKGVAASRVVEVIERRNAANAAARTPPDDSQKDINVTESAREFPETSPDKLPLPELPSGLQHHVAVARAEALVKLYDDLHKCWSECSPTERK